MTQSKGIFVIKFMHSTSCNLIFFILGGKLSNGLSNSYPKVRCFIELGSLSTFLLKLNYNQKLTSLDFLVGYPLFY
jgi:hypothetical protein